MNIFTMTSNSKKSNIFADKAEFLSDNIDGMIYSSHNKNNSKLCWHHHHSLLFTLEIHKSLSLKFDDKLNFFPIMNQDMETDFDARYYYYPHN
jgi:hypothetical protein